MAKRKKWGIPKLEPCLGCKAPTLGIGVVTMFRKFKRRQIKVEIEIKQVNLRTYKEKYPHICTKCFRDVAEAAVEKL